jgi:phosphohistidine phosphatase SixA
VITITEESGWSYSEGVYTIEDGANVIVTGGTETNRVVVAPGARATVTLSGVTIDVSNIANACAFDMTGANVTLVLSETNTLKSNGNAAGLQVNEGAILVIEDA